MAQAHLKQGSYGLRREVLSPMETLAQSVSTIAPTTTPVATIPLVCALARNGAWQGHNSRSSRAKRRLLHHSAADARRLGRCHFLSTIPTKPTSPPDSAIFFAKPGSGAWTFRS
jgi:hypothetical protein